jgi:acyl carrier protein
VSVRDDLRALVAEHAPVPSDDDAPLDLDSLTTVTIVEAIEDRFGIKVAARDVVPANFATLAKLAAYVERRRA